MYALLVISTGVGTAYLSSRITHGAIFRMVDLLIGVVGGLVGISVGQYLGLAGSGWNVGLPLLIACGLTLGLSRSRAAHA
jgi:hypothetical protein